MKVLIMNYILLSKKVKEKLEEKHCDYMNKFNYERNVDSFIRDMISFNNIFCLYNRKQKCENSNEYNYSLIGKKCRLFVRREQRCPDCLFIFGIYFFENEAEYCSKLAQTVKLPGEWRIQFDSSLPDLNEVEDISEFLDGISSYREIDEYSKQWALWDKYNEIQRKVEEEREEKSVTEIKSAVVEGNEMRIVLNNWNELYQIDKSVAVQKMDDERYQKLGEISKVNGSSCEIYVTCDEKKIEYYLNHETDRYIRIKLEDYGKKSKLKRQKEILKKLFLQETANPNLREIVDGNFFYSAKEPDIKALKPNLNVNQNQAFVGALNAEDIYLIQGPPGTGKTTIISELLKTLVAEDKSILISSETHVAVDNVLERVKHFEKIVPLRLGNEEKIGIESLEYLPEKVAKATLEKSIKEQNILRKKGYDVEALLKSKNEKYDQIIKNLLRDKKKYQDQLPEGALSKKLIDDISQFESLLNDYNEQYLVYQRSDEIQSASAIGIKHKQKRMELKKKKIIEQIGQDDSFLVTIHKIKEQTDVINKIDQQIDLCKIKFEQEKAELARHVAEKNELLNKSEMIREEWEHISQSRETQTEIENIYMNSANVIFSTCSGIAAKANNNFFTKTYDYVIVDEAARCNMLDLLIPLSLGRKIILVGDHKQLFPMIEKCSDDKEMSEEEMEMLKNHILFKYLFENNVPDGYKQMLNVQYRMPSDVSQFVSHNFYDDGLECGKENKNANTMVMIDCETSKERKKGDSYQNVEEVKIIVNLLEKLEVEYSEKTSVGIICMYKKQAELIEAELKDLYFEYLNIECNTVDAFQGKEKHTIILNTVRSKRTSNFFKEENRINVAVSRTQNKLYIVGCGDLLKNNRSGKFSELYNQIASQGKIYNSNYVRM